MMNTSKKPKKQTTKQDKKPSMKKPLVHSGGEYLFEATKTEEVKNPKWHIPLNHYAASIKKIVQDQPILSCRSYRKDNKSYLTLTLEGNDTVCVIDLIESGDTLMPELDKCFHKKANLGASTGWHSTWHLIDSIDMFHIACFIGEYLNAQMRVNEDNYADILMIQKVQQSRICQLFKAEAYL